ncbi:MAG: amidohydrolase [Gemmatales bacterium]|nr:amidohydrolase [Gemmatales bacterium]MDW8175292.1 amidohydrolase [Gemmatales bacterium]
MRCGIAPWPMFVLTLILISSVSVYCPAADPPAATDLPELGKAIRALVDKDYPYLDALYKHLHAHPELSFQEKETAARLAKEMRQIGFEVTENVGKTGLVCVLKNGSGPVILVRTDMDALPIVERTGLGYASQVRVRNAEGREVGVMHACGHDVHMTCWIGTARVLAQLKDRWKGTLVFIAQPAEEIGAGARAMLEDGLFKRFPKPDYALALHCDGQAPYGTVNYTEGPSLANADAVDIIVRGRGGHGAAPHQTIDPVVIAARIILDLQTIASRETDPLDAVVVSVGAIHGGTKHNIIPSEVHLQLTVRTFKDATRQHVLEAIERIAKAAAQAARAPEPIVRVHPGEFTPSLVNDIPLTRRTVAALKAVLGEDKVLPRPPVMGAEDFSRYAQAGVPVCMFRIGTVEPQRIEEARQGGRPLPSLHSDEYYPIPEPTIKTGVLAMSVAVLNLLAR